MSASVLVIDDDASVRSSTVAYLDDCDYRVFSADNGECGLTVLAAERIDAIVCDLKMPGLHGIELLERIKEKHPNLPVLIISGAGVMDDAVKALRLGADDFLVKPIIDLEVLDHALRKALHRIHLQEENANYRVHLERTNRELKDHLEELRSDQLAGRQVQLKMLPDPFEFKSIRCNHKIYPSLLLSGDFLDYFEIDNDQLAFYIADVSGHGASSAFVTVLLKNHTFRLRRHLQREQQHLAPQPDEVLKRLNDEIIGSGLDKHLTIFCGIICTKTSRLRYSVGGHLPMPILKTATSTKYLEGRGMPVGLFPDAQYGSYSIELPDDFSLYLFSDGILEVMAEDSLAEKESRLLEVADMSENNLERFTDYFDLREDREVPDDIGMLCISRKCQ